MRRLISISTAVALVLALASPLLAGTCMKTSGRASCHRMSQATPHHHCDGMPGDEEMSAPASDNSVGGVSSACPMNCCTLTSAGKQAAVALPLTVPPAISVSSKLHSVAVVFTATGHSSHTNRGPPAA
ncbi:MAG TPA: hypothetical protein VG488_02555 [Candidatus Angelobacter sp.]|nr:hypothetical protein [Candidatus Angelobacter sp.]